MCTVRGAVGAMEMEGDGYRPACSHREWMPRRSVKVEWSWKLASMFVDRLFTSGASVDGTAGVGNVEMETG